MLNNFFQNHENSTLFEDFFKKEFNSHDSRLNQLEFFKIIYENNILNDLFSYPKPPNFIDTLIDIGNKCKSHGLLLSMAAHFFACETVFRYYSNNLLHEKIYAEIRSGYKITAFAATEIDAGSDVMSLQTHYDVNNEKYTLNGEKSYITNATTADYILVFATKNPKLHERGLSVFLVEKNLPGISVEPLDTSNTLSNSGLGNIAFKNVTVTKEYLIGKELLGAKIFKKALNTERAYILIPQIGTMLRWYNQCVSHIKNREQFQQKLLKFQYINDKILEMYESIKISYLLSNEMVKSAEISECDASFIKNYISRALQKCHQHSLSILGAASIFGDNKISESLVDTFSTSIYSGTYEIQKNIIFNSIIDDSNEYAE